MPIAEPAHALIVAVSNYHTRPLRECVRTGAEELATWLTTTGGYDPSRVTLLTDSAATRTGILDALDRLTRCSPQATVLVYLAGHCTRVASGPHAGDYFAPIDIQSQDLGGSGPNGISSSVLATALASIPARYILTVLDCCRAGNMLLDYERSTASDPSHVAALDQSLPKGGGRVFLAATRADESAWIRPQHDYTQLGAHLLSGLRGGASSVGGFVRVLDLTDFILTGMSTETRTQAPVFSGKVEVNFGIARAPAPTRALTRLDDGHDYDVYISNVRADGSWVEKTLRPRLEAAGVRVMTERDFRLGTPEIQSMARAVERSRYTLTVLSQAAIADGFANLARAMAQHLGAQLDDGRLLGVVREPCPLALELRITAPLDMTDDLEIAANVGRLVENLWQPRPRQGA